MSRKNPAREFIRLVNEGIDWELPDGISSNRARPMFTAERMRELFELAETERVLVTHDRYEFVATWDRWLPATHVLWGLRIPPLRYIIRENGAEVYRTAYKTHLLAHWHFLKTGEWPQERIRKSPRLTIDKNVGEIATIELISQGDLYPRLHATYVRVAKYLVGGDDPGEVWPHFMGVVSIWSDRQERRVLMAEKRQIALRIADRFYQEWRVNPQDYKEAT